MWGVINTTVPGVFSILTGIWTRCRICPPTSASPRTSTKHLTQIPGQILKTPDNICLYIALSQKLKSLQFTLRLQKGHKQTHSIYNDSKLHKIHKHCLVNTCRYNTNNTYTKIYNHIGLTHNSLL